MSRAIQHYELHMWDRALAEFLALAESYRGTPEGSNCLFWASDVALLAGDEDQSLAILNRITQEYAGSHMELSARVRIVERTFASNREERLAAFDQLAQGRGAPPLSVLMDPSWKLENTIAIRSLPPESRRGLVLLYETVVGELAFHPPLEGWVIGQVMRGALDRDGRAAFFGSLYNRARNAYERDNVWSPSEILFQNPIIAPVSPDEGSTHSADGFLEAQVHLESFHGMGLDLAELRLSLDGQDVTARSSFECSAGLTFVEGQPWEVVTVRLPLSELPLGPHTATIVSQVEQYPGQGPGLTTKTWSFNIADQASEAAIYPSKDSTLRLRDPHLNEGANPRLILEKIQGKTTHPLVGFDLTQQRLTGLTWCSPSTPATLPPAGAAGVTS